MHPYTRQLLTGYGSSVGVPIGAGLGLGTNAIGVIDLAVGDDHAFNSGEIVANGFTANIVPTLGAAVGAGIGAAGNVMRSRRRMPAADAVVPMQQGPSGAYVAPDRFGPRGLQGVDAYGLGSSMALGGAIGTGVAAVPALGYMGQDIVSREQGESERLSQALSMKDRQELNALLDTHSDGPAF